MTTLDLVLRGGRVIDPARDVDGTYDVFRVGAKAITPGRVTIRVGTPIATEGLTLRDKERLSREAREQIQGMLFGEHLSSL